jgi:GNAT superfamily N-acetyltransferase
MQVRSLLFRTDLMVRRLGGSEVSDLGDHIVIRTPINPWFHWGNYLLVGADHGNVQRWLDCFAQHFPDAGHRAIGLDGLAPDDPSLDRYRSAGVTVDSFTGLTMPADRMAGIDGEEVDGASIRPLRGDDDWRQLYEHERVFRPEDRDRDTVPAFAAARVAEWRGITERGDGAWFGMFTGEDLVASLGIVSDGQGDARYQAVNTQSAFRRRGFARALVVAAGHHAIERYGASRLVIGADPEYHAITLYRRIGFVDTDHEIQLS